MNVPGLLLNYSLFYCVTNIDSIVSYVVRKNEAGTFNLANASVAKSGLFELRTTSLHILLPKTQL